MSGGWGGGMGDEDVTHLVWGHSGLLQLMGEIIQCYGLVIVKDSFF